MKISVTFLLHFPSTQLLPYCYDIFASKTSNTFIFFHLVLACKTFVRIERVFNWTFEWRSLFCWLFTESAVENRLIYARLKVKEEKHLSFRLVVQHCSNGLHCGIRMFFFWVTCYRTLWATFWLVGWLVGWFHWFFRCVF